MSLRVNINIVRNNMAAGFRTVKLMAVAVTLLAGQSAHAGLIETVEAAGVQATTATNTTTIDFNKLSAGYSNGLTVNVTSTLTVA